MKVDKIKIIYQCRNFTEEENESCRKSWKNFINDVCKRHMIEDLTDLDLIREPLNIHFMFSIPFDDNEDIKVYRKDFHLIFIYQDIIYIKNILQDLKIMVHLAVLPTVK